MEHIRMERREAVGIITIDRSERFNSLDVSTARDFRKAGLQYARDEAVRAVVLRGREGVFCSGADLKYIQAGGEATDLSYLRPGIDPASGGFGAVFKQILEYIHSAISEIRRAPKPFLAAVDGVAAAGGFGIAMSCDLAFASERASFEWAYPKTGLSGAEGSTFLLPKLIGFRKTMELLILNPRLDAHAALESGLVNEVLPVEGFDENVLERALRIASGPTRAFGVAKRLVNRATGLDRIDEHLDLELDQLTRIAGTSDFREGLSGFLEKRPPRFGGR